MVALRLRFYQFYQKLTYKCQTNNVNLKLVNEKDTTKCCSYCAHIKENLGGNKVYECANCNIIMLRNINGSRGVLIRGIEN